MNLSFRTEAILSILGFIFLVALVTALGMVCNYLSDFAGH
jgi:hypothetical protein